MIAKSHVEVLRILCYHFPSFPLLSVPCKHPFVFLHLSRKKAFVRETVKASNNETHAHTARSERRALARPRGYIVGVNF